jgi:hypothetical protein
MGGVLLRPFVQPKIEATKNSPLFWARSFGSPPTTSRKGTSVMQQSRHACVMQQSTSWQLIAFVTHVRHTLPDTRFVSS